MKKIDTWIDNKVVQNVFVWGCLFLVLVGGIQSENRLSAAFYAILFIVPTIYSTNYFILPFFNKKKITFFIFFILNGIIFTIIPVYLISKSLKQTLSLKMFLNLFGFVLLAMVFGMAIKIARDSFSRRQQEKEAELKLLKAQLNPHFLFNTLNNLYGLSVVKSDKLPSLMLKLSDLLRYSLYETKEVYVALEKELSYLQNYVSLEKIRLEEQSEINFKLEGNYIGKQIAPMLLIVFVENAFKHLGVSLDEKSNVKVLVDVTDENLKFECINSTDSGLKENDLEKGKSGIGLQNVKKRLSLMYPETHKLEIVKTVNEYKVKLILNF